MKGNADIPRDLSAPAVQAARRLQALPGGRFHLVALLKVGRSWLLGVLSGEGVKVERLDDREGDET